MVWACDADELPEGEALEDGVPEAEPLPLVLAVALELGLAEPLPLPDDEADDVWLGVGEQTVLIARRRTPP